MFEQQHDGVNDIFFIDLNDLHFFEQHLSQWDARMIHLQPVLPMDHMAEIKLFIKHINMQANLWPFKDSPVAF